MKTYIDELIERFETLREALIKQNLWTEQSVDEDILPYINEDDIAEYEAILKEV